MQSGTGLNHAQYIFLPPKQVMVSFFVVHVQLFNLYLAGIIKYPFGGGSNMQMNGSFQGFLLDHAFFGLVIL